MQTREPSHFNSSPLGQSGYYFADSIFFRMKVFYFTSISLKFVPKGPSDNKSSLVQVKAWQQTGDKPLPEPMLTQFTNAYKRH